jgi:hypothetical protein
MLFSWQAIMHLMAEGYHSIISSSILMANGTHTTQSM